jgi:hypothetical protein
VKCGRQDPQFRFPSSSFSSCSPRIRDLPSVNFARISSSFFADSASPNVSGLSPMADSISVTFKAKPSSRRKASRRIASLWAGTSAGAYSRSLQKIAFSATTPWHQLPSSTNSSPTTEAGSITSGQARTHTRLAQLSKKLRSFRDRLGCFSFRSALASI